ncbi:MAG TPA: TIGR00266 family protein [Thermoanaerobaculia bacterium]|nr:TIGR00266 family protein [Thermoanaerobaculia bacterium]
MSTMWYVAINGQQEGPLPEEELLGRIRSGRLGRGAHVFTQGMGAWAQIESQAPFAGWLGSAPPLPPPAPGGFGRAHEIDYEIFGEEMQFVEITLDPGEACIAEAGAFLFMENGIEMETVFGDGSGKDGGRFFDKLLGAGKRLLTGESLFTTVFSNAGQGRRKVAFASPYPGKIVAVDLKTHGGTLLCQKDAFLCAAKGVALGIAFQKKLGAGLFGGEGFILEKLEGDGLAFIHASGVVVEKVLGPGETLRLDTGCLVAFEPGVNYDVQFVPGVKTALFGGEGLFFATLTGPGKVWVQSLPFSRLAGRVWAAAPQNPVGGRREEGSILGGLGNLLDGD